MATSIENLKAVAKAIIQDEVETTEFCVVYEDEELDWLTEEEQRQVHNLITSAKVAVHWD